MRAQTRQWIAIGYCTAVLVVAAWFWSRQIHSVVELLRLAYG
jgi:hypothetical protein